MPKTDTILSAKSLRYFLQLIDTMNYTQAAQILGITQPALTQQIKKLERAIGAPLFGQMGKKLYLTEAGKEMQSAAVELLDTINSVVDNIQEFTQINKGHINIGVIQTLDLTIFRNFLMYYNRKFPETTINVVELSRKELWQRLDNNLLDFAIMYLPDSTKRDEVKLQHQYDHFDVYKDRLVVLTHKDKIKENESYPISRFLRRKWVAYPEGFYLTQIMKELYGNKNKPVIPITISSTHQIIEFAEHTDYDTFITQSYYLRHKPEISLPAVHIKKDKEFQISLIYRKGKLEIPRIENFIKEWQNFLEKHDYSSRLKERFK